MDGIKVDMIFTDPPYGINIVNNNGKVGADNLAKNGVYAKVIADESTETAKKAYELWSDRCEKNNIMGRKLFFRFLAKFRRLDNLG